jgi:hypothetical protein
VALFLCFGVGLVFAALGANVVPMAAAQNICPPGQTFAIAQGGCVATQPSTQPSTQPGVNCPQGQRYNAQTNQCVTAQVNCPQGQTYDAQSNRCMTARIQCPQGQLLDTQTNRCVTSGSVPNLPGLQR